MGFEVKEGTDHICFVLSLWSLTYSFPPPPPDEVLVSFWLLILAFLKSR
jgi:hypothetical protein